MAGLWGGGGGNFKIPAFLKDISDAVESSIDETLGIDEELANAKPKAAPPPAVVNDLEDDEDFFEEWGVGGVEEEEEEEAPAELPGDEAPQQEPAEQVPERESPRPETPPEQAPPEQAPPEQAPPQQAPPEQATPEEAPPEEPPQEPSPKPAPAVRRKTPSKDVSQLVEKTEQLKTELLGDDEAGALLQSKLSNLYMQVEELKEALVERSTMLEAQQHENEALHTSNHDLSQTIEAVQESLAQQKADMSQLKEEFARRLTAKDKKLKEVFRERDELREQVSGSAAELLAEKDTQIQGLLEEGERLSKRILTLEGTTKKLRGAQKEHDKTTDALKKKIAALEDTNASLGDKIRTLEASEKSSKEALSQAKDMSQLFSSQIEEKSTEVETCHSRIKDLMESLDLAHKQLAELRISQSVARESAEATKKDVEEKSREQTQKELLKAQRDFADREQDLAKEIADLQATLSRQRDQAEWKEAELRKQIQILNDRCRESEQRWQELSESTTDAAKPYLRQMQAIQKTHDAKAEAWAMTEAHLNSKLDETVRELTAAQELERVAQEQASDLSARVGALDAQLATMRTEKAALHAEIGTIERKLQDKETELDKSLALAREAHGQAKTLEAEVKQKEAQFQRSMLQEQERWEQRLDEARQEARTQQQQQQQQQRELAAAQSPTKAITESPVKAVSRKKKTLNVGASSQQSILEQSISGASEPLAMVVNDWQKQLVQRQGEAGALRDQLADLERNRDLMAEELVTLTTQNETLRADVSRLPGLEAELQELQQRFVAALELMGEKAEQVEELQADLKDVKLAYQQQIEVLVDQLGRK